MFGYMIFHLCCAAKPLCLCKCGYMDTENGKFKILIPLHDGYRTLRCFTAYLMLFLINRNKSPGFNSVCIGSESLYIMKSKHRSPWI